MTLLLQSLSEIINEIKQMGYVVSDFKNTTPSFYRLEDGTILVALIRAQYVLRDEYSKTNHLVSSNTECYVFTNKRTKNPPQRSTTNPPPILKSNMKFEVLLEQFNTFCLSDGVTVNIKTVLSQVNKIDMLTRIGEPIYSIQATPVININTSNQE